MKASKPTSQPSCKDDYDPNSLPADIAVDRILQNLRSIAGTETVAIRTALSRVLASDIVSPLNVPGHTNSAMDGYAIRSDDIPKSDGHRLKNIGTSWAGKPYSGTVQSGECVRIMTGAAMPQGTDTVVMQEHVSVDGDQVTIGNTEQQGQNVRQAGEDLAVGDTVFTHGKHLTPADIGLLASIGISEVSVTRKLRVAFFSTGDELRSIGQPLETGQIYDSNRYTLWGMLERLNVEIIDMGVIRDTREEVESAFSIASKCADVIITSGGVSVGEADFVKETLDKLGEVNFWKVAMKPGRPLAFGKISDAYFFGLPGNPVSVMVTFYIFVLPALQKLMGQTPPPRIRLQATCNDRLRKRPGRVEYQRGFYTQDTEGNTQVRKTGQQGSGILRSMSDANCFIFLPMDSEGIEAGDNVEIWPFDSFV